VLLPGHGPIPDNPRAEIKRHIRILNEIKKEIINIIMKNGGEISFSELENQVKLVHGRNLVEVLIALEKRGIIKIEGTSLTKSKIILKSKNHFLTNNS